MYESEYKIKFSDFANFKERKRNLKNSYIYIRYEGLSRTNSLVPSGQVIFSIVGGRIHEQSPQPREVSELDQVLVQKWMRGLFW